MLGTWLILPQLNSATKPLLNTWSIPVEYRFSVLKQGNTDLRIDSYQLEVVKLAGVRTDNCFY